MEVKYLGWASFMISGEEVTLIIDPFDPAQVGIPWKKPVADIVCVTHQHQDHNYVRGVKGVSLVIDGPGEYEVKGVRIFGILSFHDDHQGRERGFNTLYRIEMGDYSVVHCGDLGQKLTQGQVEQLGSVDIFIIPVGGKYTISYEIAAEVVAQVEPAIVVPCHYHMEGLKIEGIDPVEKFLEEMGDGSVESLGSLKLSSRSQLPEETQVKVLELSGM